jgi:hypothetical protein
LIGNAQGVYQAPNPDRGRHEKEHDESHGPDDTCRTVRGLLNSLKRPLMRCPAHAADPAVIDFRPLRDC